MPAQGSREGQSWSRGRIVHEPGQVLMIKSQGVPQTVTTTWFLSRVARYKLKLRSRLASGTRSWSEVCRNPAIFLSGQWGAVDEEVATTTKWWSYGMTNEACSLCGDRGGWRWRSESGEVVGVNKGWRRKFWQRKFGRENSGRYVLSAPRF